MLFSNTDLYKGEWLDLVFKNRNHQYGAYALRRENDNLMLKIASGTFIAFALFGVTMTVIAHNKVIEPARPKEHFVDIPLDPDKVFEMQKKKVEPVKAEKAPAAPKELKQVKPTPTQQFISMKPAPESVAEDPKPLEANVAVGQTEVKGEPTGELNTAPTGNGTDAKGVEGGDVDGTNGTEVLNIVQVMPEPVGGMDAWNKFLQKTLRYPVLAQEEGIGGKTFMSFIVEKDGSISNIEVMRKAGHGFDEESARVLRLAKPWKPGMQNGKAVRVRYVLPINFQVEAN